MPPLPTTLDGTLSRRPDGTWCWSDGASEPRVTDLSPDRWSWRCRLYAGSSYVEVLAGVARETPELDWVLEGARAGRYRSGINGDHAGPRIVLDAEGESRPMHIRPGEDPLRGHEPMPEAPGPIPSVVLVPWPDWQAWCREHPAGAEWSHADEPAILDRAYALGWRPPPGFTSPAGWRAPPPGAP